MFKKVTAVEAFFATSFIIILVWLVSLIPLNLEILNPIEKTFSDFKLTDIYFSQIKESPEVSEDIVLVNIGVLPREGIAEMVNIINQYEPKVIGIDAFFRNPKTPRGDSALAAAFSNTKNLVLVSELYEDKAGQRVDSIGTSNIRFMRYASHGFADLLTKGENVFKVARECIPKEDFNEKKVFSFPVQLVKHYDPETAEKFIGRNNETEEINYQGNIITNLKGASENSKNVFYALDVRQVFERQFEPSVIKDKIVIMGFMGANFEDPSWIDKFYTPLNQNYLGKTHPDMFGVVVHANIAAMILKGAFINRIPEYWDYFLSLVFIFFNTWLFAWMFKNFKEWYDGASILVTLVEVIILMATSILVFHLYHYKFDITFPLVALFLMGNLIEIYFGIILPGTNKGKLNKRALSFKSQKKFKEKTKAV